ncbi:MAG: hypothetical protein LBG81_03375 [Coriobacteriaceae bacterium]|jgi:protein-tyrosine phosphatase|nr:hypothetical protein [Coriobacteriaceae bacterium]
MIPQIECLAGSNIVLNGYAIDCGHAISSVEFSLDGGAHWSRYETKGANDYQRVNWSFEFPAPEKGSYLLQVRSVNDEGTPSPEADSVELLVS